MNVKITQLEIALPVALDLRTPEPLGIAAEVLSGDNYEPGQIIGAAAYTAGSSGLLVPSATGLGEATGDYNVIVFFELTGRTMAVYGFPVPEATPRDGVTVRIVSSERPVLPRFPPS